MGQNAWIWPMVETWVMVWPFCYRCLNIMNNNQTLWIIIIIIFHIHLYCDNCIIAWLKPLWKIMNTHTHTLVFIKEELFIKVLHKTLETNFLFLNCLSQLFQAPESIDLRKITSTPFSLYSTCIAFKSKQWKLVKFKHT